MELFGLIGILGYILAVTWLTPIFPLLYVVLRWRSGPDHPVGTGTHGALLYFTCVGFLMTLAGGANLLYGIISITPVNEELERLSWGLLVSGMSVTVLNVVLMRTLGPLSDPREVVRVFLGFLMVMTGMVAIGATALLCITMFQAVGDSEELATVRSDDLRAYGVWALLFVAAYLLVTRTLARDARNGADS
ncbi:MAG: hypothetical protein ACYTGN_10140 [Planctomycetota bacterium]|jgi:hypothetical protein